MDKLEIFIRNNLKEIVDDYFNIYTDNIEISLKQKILKIDNNDYSYKLDDLILYVESTFKGFTEIKEIKIFAENERFKDFNFKEGYAYWKTQFGEFATSGWECNNNIYVYEYKNNNWNGSWKTIEEDKEIVLDKINDYLEDIDLKKARKEAETKKDELYIIENGESLNFTDVIPGRFSDNGGDYGFSSHYKAIEPGIYEYSTSCTCDFDACGTGYKGLVVLTIKDVERLTKKEKEIYKEGCKY